MADVGADAPLQIGFFALHCRAIHAEFSSRCAWVGTDSPARRQRGIAAPGQGGTDDQPEYRTAVVAGAGSRASPVLRESVP